MKINGAPLLYARTYTVDFGSRFLVQPDFFTKTEAEWAFSIVSSSMDHSDFMGKDGRRIIFGNGRVIVVGVVTLFEELFKKCEREPVYNHLDHEGGRTAYGFIGVAVQYQRAGGVFDIPTEVFVDLYCESIAPIWNRADIEDSVVVSAREISVTERIQEPDREIRQTISFSQQRRHPAVFKNDVALCEKVSHCVLAQALKGSKITFCSNVDEIREDYRRIFDVVTCANPMSLVSTSKSESHGLNTGVSELGMKEMQGYDRLISSNSVSGDKASNKNAQENGKTPRSQARRELSFDDIVEPNNTPEVKKNFSSKNTLKNTFLDEEISRYNRTKDSKITPADGILTLGVISGITYCVVGTINSSNPVVLALAGAITLVFVGMEAKRIIDRFS